MRKGRILFALLLAVFLTAVLSIGVSATAPSNACYGYTTLPNEGTRYVYALLEEAVPTLQEEIFIPEGTLTQEELLLVRDAFASDYPEYFWFRGSMSVMNRAGVGWTAELHYAFGEETVTADSASLIEARRALDGRVEDLLSTIPADCDTDEERALYLHDLLAGEIEYVFNEHDQTVYGALVEGQAVCAGYARAYQLLLQAVGIDAWYVSGEGGNPISGETEAHAWNLVFLNDVCYYTDLTWNDQGDELYHAYYNLSLADMSLDHLPKNPSLLPICAHAALDYFTAMSGVGSGVGRVNDQTTGAEAALFFPSLDIEGTTGRVEASLYYDGADFGAWLNREKSTLVSALGLSGSVSFQYGWIGNEYRLSISGRATVIPLEEILLSQSELTLTTAGDTFLEVELRPSNTTERSLVWSSGDETVLRVSAGRLIPVSNGVAVVRVSTSDGSLYAECTVTVALPKTAVRVIRVSGVSSPAAGGRPDTEAALSEGVLCVSLVWEASPDGTEGSYVQMNGLFMADTYYRMVLTVRADEGFALEDSVEALMDEVFATVEREGELVRIVYEYGRLGAISHFEVTYSVGRGTLAPYTVTQYPPTPTLLIQPPQPWLENHVFVGWFQDPEGEDAWNFSTDLLEGNLTLYAVFRERTPGDHVHALRLQEHPGVPTTCTSHGRRTVYSCPDCGAFFMDAEGKFRVTTEQNYILSGTLAGAHADADGNGLCDVCGAEVPSVGGGATEETAPDADRQNEPYRQKPAFLWSRVRIASFEVPMLLLVGLGGLVVLLPVLFVAARKKK